MAITWQQFAAIPNGTRIFNHGADQCVALANHYHENVLGGAFIGVHSAHQWWTGSWAEINRLYTKSLYPVAGAIFIAQGGIYDRVYGHIGVVTGVNANGSFNTMEQNAGTGSARWTWRFTRANDNSIWGFLIPKNNPATSGGKLEAHQRLAHPEGVIRRESPTSKSRDMGDPILGGTVGNFNGWIRGESVGGNNIWFRGISGAWFWSGGFTSQATTGLTDLNPVVPPAPIPIKPNERKVDPNYPLLVRAEPKRSAKQVTELPVNKVVTVDGWVNGEAVSGNKVWYKTSGGYSWSGGFTSQSTTGLPDLNPVVPPAPVPDPVVPDFVPFEAFSSVVTKVEPAHSNNYEFGNIPSKQTNVVLHDYGTDGRDTFAGTVSWFKNPAAYASAHFVVSGGNIVQMVALKDRAYHAGPSGNGFIGIELDPAVGRGAGDPLKETTIASAKKLLRALEDFYGNPLTRRKHPEFMATSCGDDINFEEYITEAQPVPVPDTEPSDSTETVAAMKELNSSIATLNATLKQIYRI